MGVFDHFPYTNFHELNLDWILKHFKEFIAELSELEDWRAQHEQDYEELKKIYDDIVAGDFPQSMIDALYQWMQDNALDLVGSMIKHVYFGLTNDGYFCAFIPENWSDVQFDTIMDYDSPLYGHLMLTYD